MSSWNSTQFSLDVSQESDSVIASFVFSLEQ